MAKIILNALVILTLLLNSAGVHPQSTRLWTKSIWSDRGMQACRGTPGNTADDYYYLQQSVYDAAGRTTLLNLGGTYQANSPTVQNAYTYFNWTTVDGLGRLKQITAGTSGDEDSLLDLRYYSGTNTPAYDAVKWAISC